MIGSFSICLFNGDESFLNNTSNALKVSSEKVWLNGVLFTVQYNGSGSLNIWDFRLGYPVVKCFHKTVKYIANYEPMDGEFYGLLIHNPWISPRRWISENSNLTPIPNKYGYYKD